MLGETESQLPLTRAALSTGGRANGTLPTTFTVWTTSEALALKQSGGLAVSSDGTFTATLPARSVTTLVSDTH